MTYYHPEEERRVWEVETHAYEHPRARYLVEFSDDESYVCLFADAYDSENGGELDIEMDDPLYDEFHQIVMKIVEVVREGDRPYNEWLSLDYRDWPVLIKDLDAGTVVYPIVQSGQQEPAT
jgi:hypothetical protein